VVTFRHDAPGTPEALWRAWDGLGDLPQLSLDVGDLPAALLVVAAHPDDETLGAGGLIAEAAAAGVRVDVVVATNGDASHPLSPTTDAATLAPRRAAEVRSAVRAVAPEATVHLLGLPDGALRADDWLLAKTLAELVVPRGWVAAPWRGDEHPDHAAAGAAAANVAGDAGALLLEFPIWAWHWGLPGDIRLPWAGALRMDLSQPARDVKARAGEAHVSQIRPLSLSPGDETLLLPGFLAHFDRPFEVFFATLPAGQVQASLSAGWFDRFYARTGEDPWGFRDRWYEQRKRALTVACLPRRRFRRVFEPGCSIGMLTQELAARCDELVAADAAEAAVRVARAQVAAWPGVSVEVRRVPADWPAGEFDLVVLSEVGYYCDRGDLQKVIDATVTSLAPDGVVVACHWRRPVPDYPLTGDDVHAALADDPRLGLLARHEEEDFRLEVYVRPPVVSVARATGLA
jgi:LmbE family N-acetylglucosaminyl deacetylase/SAM-dependent methyltransferase